MAKQNVLTRSKKNRAQQLFRSNHLQEARALYAEVCRSDRTDTDAWIMQGIINRKLGFFADAEACCRSALTINPGIAAAHHALGAAVQCQGRMEESIASYRAAIRLEPENAEAHYFLANALKDSGSFKDAVIHYQEAIALKPNFLEALSNLGAALTVLCQLDEATNVLNRAQLIQPNVPQVLINMGNLLLLDGRYDEARERFQRALNFAPDSIDALAKLAEVNERTSQLEEAKPFVERGLLLDPVNVTLNLVAAKIARSESRFENAIVFLEKIAISNIDTERAVDVYLSLGKLYDRVGDAEQAFHYFTEGNRLVEQKMISADGSGERYWRTLDQLASYLTDNLSNAWKDSGDLVNEEPSPVFLMGFARSCTTLLDQILDSHPRLHGLEEKPTLDEVSKVFFDMAGDRPDALANLSSDEIGQLRKVYFDAVAKYVKLKPGVTLVDKMPLNTVNVHLIWRIFPKAKIIFAVRHPCDVCLSCFMQNFVLNGAMSNFLTIESTARLYARVMGLWQDFTRMLPIDYHQVRYEDLVADFEGETRRLLDFLGVGWDDAVREHAQHARKRNIATPSYHQVTQPIYQHAKYRWKRYAQHLEPVMKTLSPYIKYFGYEEDPS